MSNKEFVVFLKDDLEYTWAQIGNELDMHPEAARSLYRRIKGTHEPKSELPSYEFSSKRISGKKIRVAFPTDIHAPYHDKHAVMLALKMVKEFDPDILMCGSDGIDFYSISSFDKNPDRKLRLRDEIDSWVRIQQQFNYRAPNADKVFIQGNHEDRLRRYLWRNDELVGTLEIDELLKLEWLGIKSVIDEVVIGDLLIKHGKYVRKESAYSARAEIEKERFSINVLTGHTHRGGTYYAQTRHGTVRADECFCLCDKNADYVKNPNWQHGIVFATVIDGLPVVEPIPFYSSGEDIFAYWRGKCYNI